jgi:hypothetical protein
MGRFYLPKPLVNTFETGRFRPSFSTVFSQGCILDRLIQTLANQDEEWIGFPGCDGVSEARGGERQDHRCVWFGKTVQDMLLR